MMLDAQFTIGATILENCFLGEAEIIVIGNSVIITMKCAKTNIKKVPWTIGLVQQKQMVFTIFWSIQALQTANIVHLGTKDALMEKSLPMIPTILMGVSEQQ